MATNCPPQMASVEDGDTSTPAANGSHDISAVVLERLGQIVCAIHGHDNLIHFEQYRMFLKCVSCGHETPGWRLPNRRPVASASGTGRPSLQPLASMAAAVDDVRRVA
jgi:hypothetical protein